MNLEEWEEKQEAKKNNPDGEAAVQPKKRRGRPPSVATKDKLPATPKAAAPPFIIKDVVPTGTEVAAFETSPAMTAISWDLPALFSQAQFEIWVKQLRKADSGVQWWYGDLWLAAKRQGWWEYGEGEEYAVKLGVEFKTIKDYGTVCRAFEKSSRNANLTFNHHRAAASQRTPKERRTLLIKAEREDLTVRQLRTSILKTRAVERTKETAFNARELGQYAVLYADPPWRYENPPVSGTRAIEGKYPTMPLAEIMALPIISVAAPDSVLYLWVPNSHLESGLQVLKAWGFHYKTNFAWAKDRIGLGYWARNQHELCLFGVRGNPGIPEACSHISSLIEAPTREHSRKPDEMYDIIDECWADTRKLELFARTEGGEVRKDWSVWGNQVGNGAEISTHVERPKYDETEADTTVSDSHDGSDDEEVNPDV